MERKKRILVVEDEIGSRKLILLVLGAAYGLIEAANARKRSIEHTRVSRWT